MKALLELIKKLYGSKALSKTIGTRTNVITLPDKDTKRFVSNELNIDAASDAAVKKAYEDVEKLIPDIPKMNDQEILTLTGNLRRLDQRINPPSAEVIEFGTKQPVSPTGIKQLAAESGQMSPPGTLMGDLESRINQLRASGKKLEDITKGKGMTLDDLLQDPTRSGGPLDPKVGIVRTAAREILEKNLKAGKIDIPDEAAKDAILKSYQGGTDPIDVLRKTYGEGVLEQLDDIADELNRAKDYKDIQKILQREKLFDATPKKTYGYDEGVYSDEEMAALLKKSEEDPEGFATGGRVGYAEGNIDPTKEKQIKQMLKMGADESTIASITGATPQQIQFVQQQQKEKKATGGRVGYAYGSGLKLIKLLKQKGTSLKKAIDDAVNNVFPTGDKKLDADMIVDDMLETYNIDRDAVDGYDILDAYDQAYKKIASPKVSSSIDISDPETASDFAKFAKQNDPEGYKKIEKITDDINNKNKAITKNAKNELIQARKNVAQSQDFVGDDVKYDARLLAEELALVRLKTNYEDLDLDSQLKLFDESYNHLLDLIQERGQIKGAIDVRSGKNILTGKQEMKPEALPGEDPITPKKRTLNASGGLAYLMGL